MTETAARVVESMVTATSALNEGASADRSGGRSEPRAVGGESQAEAQTRVANRMEAEAKGRDITMGATLAHATGKRGENMG